MNKRTPDGYVSELERQRARAAIAAVKGGEA